MIRIKTKLTFITLLSLFGLQACSTQPPKSLMDIQAGEIFILKQSLVIPSGKARTFIQFGQTSMGTFNHYEPHCRMEVRNLSEQPQTIYPEEFVISRVNIGEEMIALQTQPIQLAQNQYTDNPTMLDAPDLLNFATMGNDREASMDIVHFYLQSNRQANVLRLTCAGSLSNGDLRDAPGSYRPQRKEINIILGEVGKINTD